MTDNFKLVEPPGDDDEIYPYFVPWNALVVQFGILVSVTVGLFLLGNTLEGFIPSILIPIVRVGIGLLPAILWFVFFWLNDRNAVAPRDKLLQVLIISGLIAGAIGLPFIEHVIQPSRWLSLESAVTRILGYAVTVGIVQEALKYIVVHYSLSPADLRVRIDTLAYFLTASVGYMTVAGLHYVVNTPSTTLDFTATRIFALFVVHIVASAVVAYGLAETTFSRALPFLLPATLLIGAILVGIAIPLQSGLVAPTISIPISVTRGFFGLGFSIAFFVAPLLVISFLFNVAIRRYEEESQS